MKRLVMTVLVLASCGPSTTYHASVESASSFDLPTNWGTMPESAFEEFAPGFGPRSLSEATLARLVEGLQDESTLCVRAAVLLARSRDPQAREACVVRLEQRVLGSTREADAGDVVAAAALANWDLSGADLDRLEPLVQSDLPHPDVEVRVELASTLARCGRSTGVPFLLRVLREGTLSQEESVEWERKPQMAWAKSRAAEVMSELAGVEVTYQEDGAFVEMEREADRLEQLLRED